MKKEVSDYFDKKLYFQPAVAKRLKIWFDPKRLKIDEKRALEIIDALEADAIEAAQGKLDKVRQVRLNADANRRKVDNIVNGKYLFLQDPFGYRVHTVLTQLPKILRSLVTYDGKQLVEVDISCSQLFFSIFLLDYRHWRTAKFKTYKRFTKELWEKISIISSSSSSIGYSNTIMYLVSLESLYGKGFQHHQFLNKCCEGLLYESVVDRLDEDNFFPADYDYKRKRNEVKTLLLDQLFANPLEPKHRGLYCSANKPILDAFTALYPEVMHVYLQIKQGHFKDLCRLLQRTESIAMQGFVCKRLQKEYPRIPIFTLHDCLITTAGNEDTIMDIMRQEIKSYVGYAPTMKQKKWSEYAAMIPAAPAKVKVV